MTASGESAWRVAFVLGSASGGMIGHVATLVSGCHAAGAAVTVFGPAETLGRLPAGTDVLVADIRDRLRPARDAVTLIGLRAGLAARRPDVIHAHGIRAGAFAALALAMLRRRGRPALAVTVHNAPPAAATSRVVYNVLERICARRAAAVLCASADLVTRMRARGADAQEFDVPAPLRPVPTAAQVAAAMTDMGAGGRPVVLAVARLAPQKGLDVLIDAAARWRDRDPQPRTLIAGAGPLAADLREQVSRSGADVVLLGARDDVPALLAAADVVVVPSRWEARALIIQEAMRAGRPIVATRVGGTPQLTGADGAVLIPADDAAALAESVAAVLDDAGLAARLGEAARRHAASLPSERDAVQSAIAIYTRLAARGLVGPNGSGRS